MQSDETMTGLSTTQF